jgi:hypothetical protein
MLGLGASRSVDIPVTGISPPLKLVTDAPLAATLNVANPLEVEFNKFNVKLVNDTFKGSPRTTSKRNGLLNEVTAPTGTDHPLVVVNVNPADKGVADPKPVT